MGTDSSCLGLANHKRDGHGMDSFAFSLLLKRIFFPQRAKLNHVSALDLWNKWMNSMSFSGQTGTNTQSVHLRN